MRMRRTDLALEARELWQEQTGAVSALPGVEARDSLREGIPVNTVQVLDERGENALGKPRGGPGPPGGGDLSPLGSGSGSGAGRADPGYSPKRPGAGGRVGQPGHHP